MTAMKISSVAAAINVAISISSSRSSMRSSIKAPPHGRADAPRRTPASGRPATGSCRFAVSEVRSVHRAAARFLQELVDQGLADARGDVLVDRHHRLAHRLVLLRRQLDELALAAL